MNASSAWRASAMRSTRNRTRGDDARLEQPLDEGRRRAGLAGPRRHLDQQLASPPRDLGGQRLDAGDLVVAVDDPPVDGDRRQVATDPARGAPPFEVVLLVEARDLSGVGIRLPIQEPHFLAVREEDERHAELFGVVPTLILRRNGIDARALGLQRRHRSALPVAEHVVGLRAVGERMFEQDAHAVGQVPARILEQGVDLDAREGFGRAAHAAVQRLTVSTPMLRNSTVLRVTTASPRVAAAARKASGTWSSSASPRLRLSSKICAHIRASSRVHATIRFSNSSSRRSWNRSARPRRRWPGSQTADAVEHFPDGDGRETEDLFGDRIQKGGDPRLGPQPHHLGDHVRADQPPERSGHPSSSPENDSGL